MEPTSAALAPLKSPRGGRHTPVQLSEHRSSFPVQALPRASALTSAYPIVIASRLAGLVRPGRLLPAAQRRRASVLAFVVVAAAAVVGVSSDAAAAATFGPVSTYAAHGDPRAVALGDFNHDGRPDLVSANNGSGDLSVLLGSAGGGFGAAIDSAPSGSPVAVATGDFNGDGKLDAVSGDGGSKDIAVRLGNGDGTFAAPTVIGGLHGNNSPDVATADFNGDGKLDIVVANGAPPGADHASISVLLGKGDGTFEAPALYYTGNTYQTAGRIAVGDFNADGHPDIVVAETGCGYGGSGPVVLLNNGDGTFASQGAIDTTTGDACPDSVAAADLNGDGRADVVTGNPQGFFNGTDHVAVYL